MAAGQRHLPRRGPHSAFERPSLVLAEPLVRRLVLSFNAVAELVDPVASTSSLSRTDMALPSSLPPVTTRLQLP
jgi:hypothetical protein